MANPISRRRRSWIVARGILLAAAAAATVPALAQEAAQPEAVAGQAAAPGSTAAITPEAQAVLDRMTTTLKGMQRYGITAHITHDEVLPFGYKLQNTQTARMWVQRPDRLRLEVEGDIKNRTYVYDGKQLNVLVPDLNLYSTAAAPSTLGELVAKLLDLGVEMPLIDMLYHGYGGDLTEDVRVGLVVGETEVDGVATDHLAFRQPAVDWQLWVEKGSQALPRKILITTRYEVGDPQYQAIMRWNLKPDINANTFTFVPPSGATMVPNHADLVAQGGDK